MPFGPGDVLDGKLRVLRKLGAGGLGAVWEVEHTLTRHHRALKVLHPRFSSSPDVIERFLREASAAGRIGNRHIVETFDAGTLADGTHYLLMELLSGAPLAERLRLGPPSIAEVVGWLRQVCLGLAAAHAAGIVHRDLKPENLFVTTGPDGKPFLKILDFGVSLFEELTGPADRLTREGSALGTPLYMSPEQLTGQRVDARADVYSLGVILYECFAGRPPFDGATMAALALKIVEGRPPPLDTARPDLPAGLVALVRRAMHVDRTQRHASALELYEALGAFELAGTETEDALGATLAPVSQASARTEQDHPTPAPARTRRAAPLAVGGLVLALTVGAALVRRPVAPLDPTPDASVVPALDAGQQPPPPPDAGAPPLTPDASVAPDAGEPPARRDAGRKSTPLITDAPY